MAKYEYKDSQGELKQTVALVLPPKRLTGVETDDTSNIVTVASTEGVWPGMAWDGPYIADGVHAYVRAVLSATRLEIWGVKWEPGTGFYEMSAENGVPMETDSDPDLIAHVSGVREFALLFEPQGVWRNEIAAKGVVNIPVKVADATVVQTTQTEFPFTLDPAYTWTTPATVVNVGQPVVHKSDSLATTPLQRHNGVPVQCFVLVSEKGYLSVLPAAGHSLAFLEHDEADAD